MARSERSIARTAAAVLLRSLRVTLLLALVGWPTLRARVAHADSAWTQSVVEDDDFWAPDNRDRHYTHGLRFSTTTGDIKEPEWLAPFDWLSAHSPAFAMDGADVSRRYNIIPLGQNMYTPENFRLSNADPHDRPYAGWLYSGIGLMQDNGGRSFEELAVKLGVVGPASLASVTQNEYHLLIDAQPFNGWTRQIHNEPTLDLYYEKKWRSFHPLDVGEGWGWDVIPQAGARVGNVYDYLAGGGLIRLGRNLLVDYGPPHIDLNTGADYVDPDRAQAGGVGFYAFFGGEARAVARNMFLDGNGFGASPSISKRPMVGDLVTGLALTWQHLRVAYSYVYRSPEFYDQHAPDHYGSLNLTLHLAF
jgi:lipid A 3-O-deacylase